MAGTRRKASPRPKKPTGTSRYIGPTVTMQEANRPKYDVSTNAKDLIAKATQDSLICAMTNATVCAAQRIRLYRASGGKGSKVWTGRPVVDRKRKSFLKDHGRAGRKVAEYADDARDFEEVPGHPATDLLKRPNDFTLGTQYERLVFLFMELTGNAYQFVNQPRGGYPAELFVLPSQHCRPMPSKAQFVEGYLYGRERTELEIFQPEEVIHTKFAESPFNPYLGVGPLHAVARESDIETAAIEAEIARWLNGGRPDFLVKIDGEADDGQREQVEAMLNNTMTGIRNTGRFLVARNLEIEPLGFSPKDMEYAAGYDRVTHAIWRAFGVPESKMALNSANLASALTSNSQYMRDTIAPRISQYAEALTQWYLPRYDLEPGEYWFAYDDCVPEDEAALTAKSVAFVNAGILTIDEARADDGREPLEDGTGEVPRIAGQPIAATAPDATEGELPATEGTPTAAPPSGELSALAVQVRKGDLPAANALAIARLSFPGVEGLEAAFSGIEVKPEPEPETKLPLNDDEPKAKAIGLVATKAGPWWAASDCGHKSIDGPGDLTPDQEKLAESLRRELAKWYVVFTPQTVNRLAAGLPAQAPEAVAELNVILGNHLPDMITAGGVRGLAEIGVGAAFDVTNESALTFLESYKVRLAREITDELETSLRDAIRAGVESGQSIQETAQLIHEATPESAGWKAERIARTEVAHAQTQGKVLAWKQAGVTQKKWLLAPGNCPMCEALAAKYNEPVPLDQPFMKVGETIEGADGKAYAATWRDIIGPPAHPNCLLPGASVLARGVVASYVAVYDGPAVELCLASGRRLSITANHKVLTSLGLQFAHAVRKGEYLVCGGITEGVIRRDPDYDYGPSLIENVVDSFLVSRGVPASRVPVAAEYFHGDGAFMHGNIDVVTSDGLLVRDAVERTKHVADLPLCFGWGPDQFDRLGDLDSMLVGLSLATYGGVSLRCKSGSFGGACVAHSHKHGLASAAWHESGTDHVSPYGQSVESDSLADALDRFSGLVSLDEVVDVRNFDYSGHVYDLQTESGLYIGNGIVTSNCRCDILPEGLTK